MFSVTNSSSQRMLARLNGVGGALNRLNDGVGETFFKESDDQKKELYSIITIFVFFIVLGFLLRLGGRYLRTMLSKK